MKQLSYYLLDGMDLQRVDNWLSKLLCLIMVVVLFVGWNGLAEGRQLVK